jgi:dihydrofolate reductase
MNRPEIALVVARARNGVIGRDNTLPWRLRDDLQQFKKLTLGKPIIMGRKTWESFGGRTLPERRHIVISRQADYLAPGATVVSSLEAALEACQDVAQICIIGGAEIYRQALSLADVLWISEIHADVAGDTVFPEFSSAQFQEATRTPFEASERNEYAFDVVEYRRAIQNRLDPVQGL